MTDEYEESACDFIGPEACEEALDEKGVTREEADRAHFEEELDGEDKLEGQ